MLRELFFSIEGKIFIVGIILTILYLILLSISWIWWPKEYQFFVGMGATNIIFGRAAGLSFGYASGFSHLVVIPFNMLIETILVLLFYPIFVLSWKSLLIIEIKALNKLIRDTKESALKYQDKIKKYGIVGLMLFVFFPFWMTGPIVGCAIGYILGFSHLLNLSVVLLGTYLAIVIWAIFLSELQEKIVAFSSTNGFELVFIILTLMIIFYILKKLIYKFKK